MFSPFWVIALNEGIGERSYLKELREALNQGARNDAKGGYRKGAKFGGGRFYIQKRENTLDQPAAQCANQ